MDSVMLIQALLWCFAFVYSVKADDFFRIPEDYRYKKLKDFRVYWNAPTFLCQKYGIDFSQFTPEYEIFANPEDKFRGNIINILYDPGAFPAVLMQSATGRKVERNGGIPQLGNLTYHLDILTKVVHQLVPTDFSGPLVLDFEAWRPTFRQNWNEQIIYLDMSKDLVRQKHPYWSENQINEQAKLDFEEAARVFLDVSLNLVQKLRPNALVGYYGFPYCYNMRHNNGMVQECSKQVQMENDRLHWMWEHSSALYTSIYLTKRLKKDQQKMFVNGRMKEALRVASRVATHDQPQVLPYLWYKYYDSPNFLSKEDLTSAVESVIKFKMGGLIIWGATHDVRSKSQCQLILDYLKTTLGPTIQSIKRKHLREHDEPIYKPLPVTEASYENRPKIIFTAVTGNGTKSIFQYQDSIPNLTTPDYGYKITNLSEKYKYSTPRSVRQNQDPINRFVRWYQRVIRNMLRLA